MMSHGLGSDRVLHHVCEESREEIAGGFKSPEEVQEAERKVAEASKKLASKIAQTRKSAEKQRALLQEEVELYEETLLPAYRASAAQSSMALTQKVDDVVEDKNVRMNQHVKQSAGLGHLPNNIDNSAGRFFSNEKTESPRKKPRVSGGHQQVSNRRWITKIVNYISGSIN